MGLTLEKQRKLAHVAQRYYLEDWKQSDIAQELGVSRPLISRMLREARELGVVEIVIHEPGAKSAILLERLRRTNAIQGGVLVEDGEDGDATNRLLSQGAVDLLRQIGARRLGVGWGYLIGQLVAWLEENPQPNSTVTDICPLVGNASIPARNYQSNENVRLMAQQLGAAPHFLYLPALPDNLEEKLGGVCGILVPGGFGDRGIEGMILAAKYAREKNIPYLGLCLGMQIAVIENARSAAHLAGANSREFDENAPYRVIDFMPGQSDEIAKGGTLRLGAYPCDVMPGSLLEKCYGAQHISERHRHRYEFNNEYREALTAAGLVLSGLSPDGRLVEVVERHDHPFYIGVQYHPEFKSRPNRPHPLFRGFVAAALELFGPRG